MSQLFSGKDTTSKNQGIFLADEGVGLNNGQENGHYSGQRELNLTNGQIIGLFYGQPIEFNDD